MGGGLVWASPDQPDGVASNVRGLTASPTDNAGGYRLLDGWLA